MSLKLVELEEKELIYTNVNCKEALLRLKSKLQKKPKLNNNILSECWSKMETEQSKNVLKSKLPKLKLRKEFKGHFGKIYMFKHQLLFFLSVVNLNVACIEILLPFCMVFVLKDWMKLKQPQQVKMVKFFHGILKMGRKILSFL